MYNVKSARSFFRVLLAPPAAGSQLPAARPAGAAARPWPRQARPDLACHGPPEAAGCAENPRDGAENMGKIWKNHGKTMGKYGKVGFEVDFTVKKWIYWDLKLIKSLVNQQKMYFTIEKVGVQPSKNAEFILKVLDVEIS